MDLIFYPGLHQPSDVRHFKRACVSIRRLLRRRKPLGDADVFVDAASFTELALHGEFKISVHEYAMLLWLLWTRGVARIVVAVSQDFMCEPFMLAKTGLTVADHQRLTIERYDDLVLALAERFGGEPPFPVLPVLQGYQSDEYLRHIEMWGERLTPDMLVGVGSVCKRQGNVAVIEDLLGAILEVRPDLRLHGFGVKLTALQSHTVRRQLHSADSMAWSYSARKQGRDGNDWREAVEFERRVLQTPAGAEQLRLFDARATA